MPGTVQESLSEIRERVAGLEKSVEHYSTTVTEIHNDLKEIRQEDLTDIKVQIAMLKVRSSVWGGVAGLLVAVGAVLLKMLT